MQSIATLGCLQTNCYNSCLLYKRQDISCTPLSHLLFCLIYHYLYSLITSLGWHFKDVTWPGDFGKLNSLQHYSDNGFCGLVALLSSGALRGEGVRSSACITVGTSGYSESRAVVSVGQDLAESETGSSGWISWNVFLPLNALLLGLGRVIGSGTRESKCRGNVGTVLEFSGILAPMFVLSASWLGPVRNAVILDSPITLWAKPSGSARASALGWVSDLFLIEDSFSLWPDDSALPPLLRLPAGLWWAFLGAGVCTPFSHHGHHCLLSKPLTWLSLSVPSNSLLSWDKVVTVDRFHIAALALYHRTLAWLIVFIKSVMKAILLFRSNLWAEMSLALNLTSPVCRQTLPSSYWEISPGWRQVYVRACTASYKVSMPMLWFWGSTSFALFESSLSTALFLDFRRLRMGNMLMRLPKTFRLEPGSLVFWEACETHCHCKEKIGELGNA